jgi:hypothetical protein
MAYLAISAKRESLMAVCILASTGLYSNILGRKPSTIGKQGNKQWKDPPTFLGEIFHQLATMVTNSCHGNNISNPQDKGYLQQNRMDGQC